MQRLRKNISTSDNVEEEDEYGRILRSLEVEKSVFDHFNGWYSS
jgi:hypothetical protein